MVYWITTGAGVGVGVPEGVFLEEGGEGWVVEAGAVVGEAEGGGGAPVEGEPFAGGVAVGVEAGEFEGGAGGLCGGRVAVADLVAEAVEVASA